MIIIYQQVRADALKTERADEWASDISGCVNTIPSACVWLVPGTEA